MASKQGRRIRIHMYTIRPARTGTFHGVHNLPQLGQCNRGDTEPTCAHSRQATRHTGRHPEAGKVGRNTGPNIDKVCVQFVRCGSGKGGGAAPLTGVSGRTMRYGALLPCSRSLSSMSARLSRLVAGRTLLSSARKADDLLSAGIDSAGVDIDSFTKGTDNK